MKKLFPVYHINSIKDDTPLHEEITAAPFAAYLKIHPHFLQPHRHSFYHLLLFTGGAGTHTIDFQQFVIRPGQIYFMAPGQVHTWNFSEDADGFVINFTEHFFNAFLKDEQLPERYPFFKGVAEQCVVNLEPEPQAYVSAIFEAIIKEVNNNEVYAHDMVCSQLITLFITVARASGLQDDKTPNPNQTIIATYKKLVNLHYAKKKLPKEYAAILNITPNHLNTICNELLGKPAGDVIKDRVMLEAKRMLVNAQVTIAEIAWQLGFSDNSYFSKYFKKQSGFSPDEFRRNL
jgi:AraC-like DNA-binding protein